MPLAFGDRVHKALSAAVARPLTWALIVALAAAWPIAWALRTPLPPKLPVLGTVRPFELTAHDGRPFGSKDLAGRAWVASFFFTRCETACADVARKMSRIQQRTRNLEPAFHLVSITIDPAFDNPGRLAAYAHVYGASPRMWTFLTGPADAVRDTVRGLRIDRGSEPGEDVSRLVLVDGESRIRGDYDPEEPGAVERVVRDAALLVNRG